MKIGNLEKYYSDSEHKRIDHITWNFESFQFTVYLLSISRKRNFIHYTTKYLQIPWKFNDWINELKVVIRNYKAEQERMKKLEMV